MLVEKVEEKVEAKETYNERNERLRELTKEITAKGGITYTSLGRRLNMKSRSSITHFLNGRDRLTVERLDILEDFLNRCIGLLEI